MDYRESVERTVWGCAVDVIAHQRIEYSFGFPVGGALSINYNYNYNHAWRIRRSGEATHLRTCAQCRDTANISVSIPQMYVNLGRYRVCIVLCVGRLTVNVCS